MEQRNLPAFAAIEKSLQSDRLSALELSLLRQFRQLSPQDQKVVFKMMEGLAALAELET